MGTIYSFLTIFFSLLITGVGTALAADDLVSCKGQRALSSKESQSIQKKLQDTYKGVNSLKAEFLQDSFMQALEISEASSGMVAFLRPGKMRWDYEVPETQQFIFSDSTMWFYQKTQNQVLIDSSSDVLLSDLPISFLLGIGDISRDFDLIVGCKREEGIVLDLAPKEKTAKTSTEGGEEKGLKGFQLLIDPERSLPIGARIVDVGGNVTTVLLRNLTVNSDIDPEIFKAQYPKGTDIQDRRKQAGE